MAAASDIALRTKRFRYDGQMPVETAAFNGTSSLTWTSTARNVLGARGVDALSTETSGGTVSTYPLYDTHGNVKAYVKKEPSNSWSSLGWKQYNVWGGVRSASGGAGTSSAYVGNLGHVSDGETGLIYMRARYYAPWAGRFISEDPARDGLNWYAYCGNEPVGKVDFSGLWEIIIGDHWFRLDRPYGESGTGSQIRDLTYGDWHRGQKRTLGSIRPDGITKHGLAMADQVKDILRSNLRAANKLKSIGKFGVYATVLTTSLDAAFASDPLGFAEIIEEVGGTWSLWGGWIQVSN